MQEGPPTAQEGQVPTARRLAQEAPARSGTHGTHFVLGETASTVL